jgi:hypothetical protein
MENPRPEAGQHVSSGSATDGVSSAWYRRLYYLNYLGGASAIFRE